jgi:protocatechuate 3,4-dioxygenase beta subunit
MTEHSDHFEEPTNEELRLMSRRRALRLLGGAGLAVIAACATDGVVTTTAAASGSSTTAGAGSSTTTAGAAATSTFGGAGTCVLIPEETQGPYPLDLSGDEEFFRSDITEDRPGLPLTPTFSLVDVNSGCAPIEGARIDVWHCDAEGVYSGYSQPGVDTTGETFLRGIQLTDANGQATFQTIYPGWYQGRITHVHFQVFFESGLAATSQIAFPEETTDAVYAVEPYAAKGPNTSVPTFAGDNVFSDGTQYQMAGVTGGADARYIAALLVGVAG